MIPVPGDSRYLILVVSVFLAFLLVLSFYYYFLKNKRHQKETSPELSTTPAPEVTAPDVVGKQPEFSLQDSPEIPHDSDITRNTLAVRLKYSLDSLTVASYDGLVVLSSGNPSAESDAAYFAYRIKKGEKIAENGVHVDSIEFRGSPLLIITKSSNRLPDDTANSIKNDIQRVLSDGL
jgi:hypothetical protein